MRRKLAGFAASIFILVTAFFFISTTATPVAASSRWGANYFPNVVLTTQDGKKVHFYDDMIKGKIVVIDLIYTHCVNACPLETARLVQVQKMLGDRVGKDIFFYSISIDPENDTPKVLREYAQKFHVGPGWTFLTGKKEDIELVGRKLGLYQDPDPNDPDGHAPTVLIGDEPNGQWINNSATDNPRFITNMIEGWLDNWKHVQSAKLARGESAIVNYESAPHIDLSNRGRYIFGSQCAACHTVGHGDKIGPDLFGVASVRETEWLRRFISESDKVIAEKDPIAVALYKKYNQVNMPNTRLTPEDVNELVKFLQSQVPAPPAKETTDPAKTSAVRTESAVQPAQQQQ
jgi:protein SCO1/2